MSDFIGAVACVGLGWGFAYLYYIKFQGRIKPPKRPRDW